MSTPAVLPGPVPAVTAPRLLEQVRQAALAHFGRLQPGER
jgi:hypothetical protein